MYNSDLTDEIPQQFFRLPDRLKSDKPKKPKGNRNQFGEHLQRLTGPVWSVKGPDGCKRMKNDKYVDWSNMRGAMLRNMRVPFRLTNKVETGDETNLKVCAKCDANQPETLLYFDFDCHKRGSLYDVAILAQVVRDIFPTMPDFVFPSGAGRAGWSLTRRPC